MFERFTDRARNTVKQSKLEAETLRHSWIGTEHLLLALLDDDAGGASRLLTGAGVAKEQVYAAIEEFRSPLPGVLDKEDAAALESIGIDLESVLSRLQATFGPVGPAPRRRRWFRRTSTECAGSAPRFSPRSKKALELSLREALRLKHKFIGTEHLLLGILREGEGLAVKILVETGVDLGELRRRTEASLRAAA